jgi:hypothetical protein
MDKEACLLENKEENFDLSVKESCHMKFKKI